VILYEALMHFAMRPSRLLPARANAGNTGWNPRMKATGGPLLHPRDSQIETGDVAQ